MTMSFTDPGEVVLTGQNPYMILFDGVEGPPSTLVSLWHVQFSPAGEGSALYVKGEITGGVPRIYTDNIALARFVQSELYANNAVPFGLFADPDIDATDAEFERQGDARSFITESVVSGADDISLSWYDFLPAFKGASAANPAGGAKHGHYALYIPSRRVRLAINGVVAKGIVRPRMRDGRETTSGGLAWAETWIRPVAV
jgi:hypothetical protein